MHFKKTASVFLIATLLLGCSSDDDDNNSSNDGDNSTLDNGSDDPESTSVLAPDVDPNDTPQTLTQYDGNYMISCRQDPENNQVWLVNELSIQSDITNVLISEFTDSECTQLIRAVGSTLSIVYPGGTANTSLGVADFIDLTVESGSLNGTPVSLNSITFFDLILLDGSSLFFGINTDELDGDTAETRPTEIDTEAAFVRL